MKTLGSILATGLLVAAVAAPLQPVLADDEQQQLQFATGPIEFSPASEQQIDGRIVSTSTYDVWVRASDGTLYDVRVAENSTVAPSVSALKHGENVTARGELQGKVFLASSIEVPDDMGIFDRPLPVQEPFEN